MINVMGLRDDPFKLFLGSFVIFSKQRVKNTFHKKLKRFYMYSNRVNMVFYTGIVLFILFVILMHA